MSKYNTKISQLGGLFVQTASEISNDDTLQAGEKYLLLQRLMADIKPATKGFDTLKSEIEKTAKELLQPNGDKESQPIELFGAEVIIKYSYPADQLDAVKLEKALQDAYAEIGAEYQVNQFTKPSTVRQTVIIQAPLNK